MDIEMSELAYLVMYDTSGIGWAGSDRVRAMEFARNTLGFVVVVPIIADYRPLRLLGEKVTKK